MRERLEKFIFDAKVVATAVGASAAVGWFSSGSSAEVLPAVGQPQQCETSCVEYEPMSPAESSMVFSGLAFVLAAGWRGTVRVRDMRVATQTQPSGELVAQEV